MEREELEKYLGTEEMSVVEAMQKIDQNAKGILYIVDKGGCLLGSLTDGDIRRWIIRTGDLSGRGFDMMYRAVRFLTEEDRGFYEAVADQFCTDYRFKGPGYGYCHKIRDFRWGEQKKDGCPQGDSHNCDGGRGRDQVVPLHQDPAQTPDPYWRRAYPGTHFECVL